MMSESTTGQATEISNNNSEGLLLSKADFARRRGWNRSTATRFAQQGKLVVTAEGLVDVQASEAILAASRDPRKDGVRARHVRERVQRELRSEGDGPQADGDDPSFRSIQKARAQSEAAKARLLQLELAERQSKLVDVAAVQRAVFAGLRGVRNRAFQIPPRLAPLLSAESDALKIEQLLERELCAIFEDAGRELREKGVLDAC